MLSKVFSVLVTISFVFAALDGRMGELCAAVISGANDAVTLVISLVGMMCLWNGIIKVLDGAGLTKLLSRLIRPILKFAYPTACSKNCGVQEISANFAANLLGLGNAALPLGLSAMEKLATLDGEKEKANADMMTFAVLATTPIQLLPTTLIILRQNSGSASPYEIITPILICSVATTVFAVVLCRLCGYFSKRKHVR